MTYQTPKAIPQTSCAQGEPGPPITVQFNRFTQIGLTAYQAHQMAGFSEEVADRIVKSGAGRIVHRA